MKWENSGIEGQKWNIIRGVHGIKSSPDAGEKEIEKKWNDWWWEAQSGMEKFTKWATDNRGKKNLKTDSKTCLLLVF